MENRIFTVRRLLKEDSRLAEKAFSAFDFLHYNPVCGKKIMNIMVCGQIWGAFDGAKMIGCTWFVPADSTFLQGTDMLWEINDLIEINAGTCMIAGYVWQDESYADTAVYAAFSRLWTVQSEKLGKTMVVHCSPRHINTDMKRLFSDRWQLRGLRGLDKLVPHFIFTKETEFTKEETEIPRERKNCPLSDTKQLSMLCEHGWVAVNIDKEQNLLFIKGDDCVD